MKGIIAEQASENNNDLSLSNTSSYLELVKESQKALKEVKSKEITFSKPILTHDSRAIIFPNTINVIQGKSGVHKSRLAETLCSSFLKTGSCENELLGFQTNDLKSLVLCYIDTERNLTEQFPYALQMIQKQAGYTIDAEPSNFEYASLLEIPRAERFSVLQKYLELLREKHEDTHLIVVLDVITDCVSDFNRGDQSMQLIDLMNVAINKQNVTFICVIHENPFSEKARGHLGTEIFNKSSTTIQVASLDQKENSTSEVIKLRFLKCRSTKRHTPIHFKYCDSTKGLVLADQEEIEQVQERKKRTAKTDDMIEALSSYLADQELSRSDLLETLQGDLRGSERTIETRLKSIYDKKTTILEKEDQTFILQKKTKDREVIYFLQAIPF